MFLLEWLGTAFILIYFIGYCFQIRQYNKTDYAKQTYTKYSKVMRDKGKYGEFLISKYLSNMTGYKKFIYNCYIPKYDNPRETIEIDVIMLHETGIYVLESKNYSGWIYGDERQQKWCQSLDNREKYYFYNPIKQNKSHIRHLKVVLSKMTQHEDYISIIIFSERCELKEIDILSDSTFVIKRNKLKKICSKIARKREDVFTANQIDEMYDILKEYCNVPRRIKRKHIKNIGR